MAKVRDRRTARVRSVAALAGGLVAGAVLDAVLGDPRRFHPVAGFGHFAQGVEGRSYADSRLAGVRHVAASVGVPVAAAAAVEVATRRYPVLRAVAVATTTWAVLGGKSLRREAEAMTSALDEGDLSRARQRIPRLCGRDPSSLDEKELIRATVESVAENTSDAVVAPLWWGAVAGLPGLVGYRAINTLDAMIGHHTPRYERFGWAAARLDDVVNVVPARLTAALTVVVAPFVGGSGPRALQVWRRDGHRHPSPNAGQCEAAAAGALGVRLGGRNVYAGRVEFRPELGDGPGPGLSDLRRASRLSGLVAATAVVATTTIPMIRLVGRVLTARRADRRELAAQSREGQ
jgi:adenosylcobinamide-phosphate synthase